MTINKNSLNSTLNGFNKFLPCTKGIFNINKNLIKSEKKRNINFNSLDTNLFYKSFLNFKFKNLFKIRTNLNFKEGVQKIILNVNRTSLTLKNSRVPRFKVITCVGCGNGWVGIGEGRHRMFRRSYLRSLHSSKKYVYNLNFNCNDYKQLKYKGCKFKALDLRENRNNLKIYENIVKLSGHKKIKLLSYSSKTPVNIIKSIINFF